MTTALPARHRIAVLYGGRSAEHDVSVMSATNVFAALDPAKYDVVPIFVTRSGAWILATVVEGRPTRPETGTTVALLPGGRGRLVAVTDDGTAEAPAPIDALLPMLHGLGGEDGSVQGVAAVADVPLVGCGILGSATALDKEIAKRLLAAAGLPVARAAVIRPDRVPAFDDLAADLGLPLFLKPARQGSSVGVGKVADAAAYAVAVAEGFRYDGKLLAEEFVAGREIECAVLEAPDGSLFVSRPGEIATAASHAFYDYDAKYRDPDGAVVTVPADLAAPVEAAARALAADAFRALGCDGMARVDLFLTAYCRLVVNEINTIPGFTDISMYPKAMAASGVAATDLLDRLVAGALARSAAGNGG
jgi:D-alanine-D-alanine ligase